MSLKKLFGKGVKNFQSASVNVESPTFIDKKVKEQQTYIPPIDFSTASNFVKYGLAELYYDNSISRIYNNYPYDGSKAEKIDFHQSSSYLDRWMFEEKYPKTTGYVNLGTTADYTANADGYGRTTTPEYIRVWGGIHTASSGMISKPLRETFDKSSKYNLDLNRTQNWRCNPLSGSTIEFWLRVPELDTTNKTKSQIILDLWNNVTYGAAGTGRMILELYSATGASAEFRLTLAGYDDFPSLINIEQETLSTQITPASLAEWHHYAITFQYGVSPPYAGASYGINTRFYIDGQEKHTVWDLGGGGDKINDLEGLYTGFVGSLQTALPTAGGAAYAGKLSGSIDEFRYWKQTRTGQQIGLNWFRQVGGGTNSDDKTANKDLGVYFKFNEGIVNNTSIDNIVLDYSGRIANGLWENYESTLSYSRNTGSAFASSSYGYLETENPIIYASQPRVKALISEMSLSGSLYDNETGRSIYHSLPEWMINEDVGQGSSNLKYLTQIIASYFDTLHAQITALPNLKNKLYVQKGQKPIPFASQLLSDKGFVTRNIFVDSEIVNLFSGVDFNAVKFQENLEKTRNLIYLNIYNNLEAIYKSKGTEKSIRNFIRCFGIDDEIIKLNVYTDGGTHYFTDKAKASSVKKKYINFDSPSFFASTMFQSSSATNPLTFISGSRTNTSASNNAFTLEADIVVPYKKGSSEIGYYGTPFLSSSIFGFHEALNNEPTNYNWADRLTGAPKHSLTASLSVYLVRDELNSKNAKFVVESQDGTLRLTSNYIQNIYDNNHWNVALRIKSEAFPLGGRVSRPGSAPGSPFNLPLGGVGQNSNYIVDFYAVNYNFDELENEVHLTAPLTFTSGSAFLNRAKRVYAGAHLTDFSGSLIHRSDVQVGAVRAWLDYIDNSAIQQHNLDPLNFGNSEAYRGSNIFTVSNKKIPSQELTIFNWDFSLVTGSSATDYFSIDDITSGSTDTIYTPWLDEVIRREYRGRGINFGASTTKFIENEFLYAQKKELPEISYTNDNVFIKTDKDINFIKDDDVSDNFYALEKSLNQIVSEQMLNLFASVQEFANLMGRPVDRYRMNYKRLDKVRHDFFDRVDGNPNQERFIQFYKWIDGNISKMIKQLIPASVNFGSGVTDVIESHILERNKYQRRIGLLDTLQATEGIMKGVEELTYNWKFGHAPLPPTGANENCVWQKERRKRGDIPDREKIREVLVNQANATSSTLSTADKTVYQGSTFIKRRLSRPYKIGIEFNNSIHGGINYPLQKDREFYRSVITPWGPKDGSGAPRNIYTVGISKGDSIIRGQYCRDVYDPMKKDYVHFECVAGKYALNFGDAPKTPSMEYLYKLHSTMYWPFNLVSGTLKTGYAKHVYDNYSETSIITNVHSDTTDLTNEIPIQGPFTEAHVGGLQFRHVDLNRYDPNLKDPDGTATENNLQDAYNRPEGFRYLFGENPLRPTPPHTDGAMGLTGPDYGGDYPDQTKKYAWWYREERAKRPVNVKNIQTTTASVVHGNYQHKYEVVSTFGMYEQRFEMREKLSTTGQGLFGTIYSTLPQTTQPNSLLGAGTLLNRKAIVVTNMPTDVVDLATDVTLDGSTITFLGPFFGPDSSRHVITVDQSTAPPSTATAINLDTVASAADVRTQVRLAIDAAITAGSIKATRVEVNSQVDKYHFHLPGNASISQIGTSFVNNDGFGSIRGSASRLGRIFTLPSQLSGASPQKTIVRTKFSAPGGPEIMSEGFLDISSLELSAYNALPFRNLTVRGSGSGEPDNCDGVASPKYCGGTIRVQSNLLKREGNRTLLARWLGKGGLDSQWGSITTEDSTGPTYKAAFYKQHRNTLMTPKITGELPARCIANVATAVDNDNMLKNYSVTWPKPGALSFSFMMKIPLIHDSIGHYIFSAWSTPAGASGGIEIIMTSSKTMNFRIWLDGSAFDSVTWTIMPPVWPLSIENTWTMVVISWDGNLDNDPQCYYNNRRMKLSTPGGTRIGNVENYNGYPAPDQIALFDRIAVSPLYELQGSLVNFAVWSTFITPNQAKELYLSDGDATSMAFAPGLIDFWRLGTESTLGNLAIGDSIVAGTAVPSDIGRRPLFAGTNLSIQAAPIKSIPVITDTAQHDNMNYNSLLPRSSYQYSWIRQAVSGNLLQFDKGSGQTPPEFGTIIKNQKVRGYAPKSGEMVTVGNGALTKLQSAIDWPLISDIPCEGIPIPCDYDDSTGETGRPIILIRWSYGKTLVVNTFATFSGTGNSWVFKAQSGTALDPYSHDEITFDQFENIKVEFLNVDPCCEDVQYDMRVKGWYYTGGGSAIEESSYLPIDWTTTPRPWISNSTYGTKTVMHWPYVDLPYVKVMINARCTTGEGMETSLEIKFTIDTVAPVWAGILP